jgi:VWFA-related protein
VQSNLVTVRVVVRDAKGRPVSGLHKEDFRLFDDRKPREITGFAVETGALQAAELPTPQPSPRPAAGAASGTAAPFPQRFVALYFDDLHMEFGDIGYTRNAAWRYISTKLRPEDRVAIFTSSDASHRGGLDFTDDRDKLHDALFRVTPHSRTIPLINDCPRMGEYQAFLIDERADQHVLDLAAQEGAVCHCLVQGDCVGHDERHEAMMKAAQIRSLSEVEARDALDVADGVVRRLAIMPGQRNLVLVSTGFLTGTLELQIGALIDRALRQNVVINAIDAAGLYTRPNVEPILLSNPHLLAEISMLENEGLNVQRDVLAGLAAGTGGTFFQNSNDFDDGFRQTAQIPEVTYVLSFSPSDVKMDGKFHALKVTVSSRHGLEIQARRGYFANAETASAKSELDRAWSTPKRNGKSSLPR